MTDALIGYSGFVGGTLLKQSQFGALYRSTNVAEIRDREFDVLVCAGAPAQKWIANREPEADQKNIEGLISHLETVTCKAFVLLSTVDVFARALGVDEDSPVEEQGLHAYGKNRRLLEKFVQARFSKHVVARLPGLVGPGLRKNVIFDFLNDNNLHAIDSRGVFQFYPMVNLWSDLTIALEQDLRLVHLTAEPVSVAEIAALGFGRKFEQPLANPAAVYDMRSKHAAAFAGQGAYQYSKRETLLAVRSYAQSEPKKAALGAVQ
jgi:nucleoside-diphosphate-sugar epimerase